MPIRRREMGNPAHVRWVYDTAMPAADVHFLASSLLKSR
jgi:hypothetical protein